MFTAPDGETEEVDENTAYWTERGDALVRFSPVWMWGRYMNTEVPGREGVFLMIIVLKVAALKKGWCKYYLSFPTEKDLHDLQKEVMET